MRRAELVNNELGYLAGEVFWFLPTAYIKCKRKEKLRGELLSQKEPVLDLGNSQPSI